MSSEDNLEILQAEYQSGKTAFERGEYRKSVKHLETANTLSNPQSRLGGEIQTWLVTAYEAAGQRSEAIALCKQITRHPDYTTRKQGKRLLYILEAPKLKTRPEWLTQIPDLTELAESDPQDRRGSSLGGSSSKQPEKPGFQLEPIDLSQANTRDNRFIWVALGAAGLALLSLIWLAQG
ncbi:hypothetical protein K9N68_20340 [Kovacikia minuta CCNUW1]|uniref:hypothetical protein n=1 Tax=Kovacikia minuta TaxID=2931930 RepID=UPI001CC9D8C0|nr:hypothetical protein [Kovacikia minuta]UBF24067.1 hypothetical protein K9N68_20340 [Kovacikia minuta CCNUW1]